MHVRLLAAFPFNDGLPLWLQEGVATSQESDAKKDGLAEVIRKADKASALIPLGSLFGAREYPEGAAGQLFYAQSVALVESLVETKGGEMFKKFVRALNSMPGDTALGTVYGISPAAAESLIRDWSAARRQADTGS
jgi:hypothetical protein